MSANLPWLQKAEGKALVVRELLDPVTLEQSVEWQPFRQGVEIFPLYGTPTGDRDAGSSAALLRYGPGASVPAHEHTDYEHVLVLRGAQQDAHGNYERGALVVSEPGSRHDVRSEEGCVVLVIWSSPVAFLEPAEPEGGAA